jgi:C-terminal processing protease CtpA/Prc
VVLGRARFLALIAFCALVASCRLAPARNLSEPGFRAQVGHRVVTTLDKQDHYFPTDRERDVFYYRMGEIAESTNDAPSYYDAVSRALASLGEGHTGLVASREVPFGDTMPPVAILEVDGYPVVAGCAPGVESGGLRCGDLILSVDGQNVATVIEERLRTTSGSTPHGHRARAMTNLLAGPTNSPAVVRVRGVDGRERTCFPLRFLMEDPGEERFRFGFADENARVTRLSSEAIHIALPDFRPKRVGELERSLIALAALPVVVLDLRGNPGGRVQTMQEIAGMFVDEGTELLEVLEEDHVDTIRARRSSVHSRAKLRILIDERTGSAAELLAAALRDLDRAELYGRTSAGSTRSRHTMLLPGEVQFHYAGKAEFRRRNGVAIEGVGVEPDVHASPSRKALADGCYGDPDRDPLIRLAAGLN